MTGWDSQWPDCLARLVAKTEPRSDLLATLLACLDAVLAFAPAI